MTIFKKIFKIQFILVAFLAGYLLTGCGGGDSSGKGKTLDPNLNCGENSSFDCDGDGLTSTCDDDDGDATNVAVKKDSGCDIEGTGGSGDGYSDIPCSYYNLNDDGTLDNRASTDALEHYSRNACDNCPSVYNPDQTDNDNDMIGDDCDSKICSDGDEDFDNVCNTEDSCPSNYNSGVDADSDEIDDACDDSIDADKDGYSTKNTDPTQIDCDDTNAEVNPGSTTAESIGSPDYNCDGQGVEVEESNAVFVDVENSVNCPNGTENCGAYNNPYNNIADAVTAAGTKDIYFYKGTANLDVVLGTNITTWTIERGTIDQLFNFYGGVTCVEKGETVKPYQCTSSSNLVRNSEDKTVFSGIYVNVKSSAVLDGFEFKGTGLYAYPVVTLSPNGGVTAPFLQNSIISGGENYMGVDINASTGTIYPTIKNNVVTASYIGVYSTGSASRTVKSIIEDNEIIVTGGYLNSFGIYFKGGFSNSSARINRNKITVATNDLTKATYGIYADAGAPYLSGAIKIYNNIISAEYTKILKTTDASVINNTFVITGSVDNSGLLVAFSSGTKVMNNLFYLESGDTSVQYGLISSHVSGLIESSNHSTLINLFDSNYIPLSTSIDIINTADSTVSTDEIGTTDFGGDSRVSGGAIDIGAQELQQDALMEGTSGGYSQ